MASIDWNSLHVVLTLARHGSLERAAVHLGVDPSTVSRKVHALEESVRARIFDRSAAGHRLTSTGQLMLRAAEQVESCIAAMERIADSADERLEGLIRISAADTVSLQLAPLLAQFRARHPAVAFEILGDSGAAALVRHDVDVAIRLSRPDQVQLASRRIAILGFGLYGGVEYLERNPIGADCDLAGHQVLGYEERFSHLPEAQWLERRSQGAHFALRASCAEVLVSAAASDLGLAVLPCFTADDSPRLVRLLGPDKVVARDVWLVVHRDLRRVARLRAFVDFLVGEARSLGARFQGGLRAAG